MLGLNRQPKITGGNIYRAVGKPNLINGQPVFRGNATLIDWKALGIDPKAVIQVNSARVKGRFIPTEKDVKQEPVAIVAYGPSLKHTWKQVADFKTIFTCSGAHQFLLERGIRPTYHVDSDPRAHKIKMLGTPHSDVTYLPASIVHPSYFDALEKYGCFKVLLWHLFFEDDLLEALPSNEALLTGGDTIGARVMHIARLMGYVNQHCFGFDFSADNKTQGHAGTHLNPRPPSRFFYEKFNGKTYLTTEDWLFHANLLLTNLDRMPEVKCRFYGDGLFQAKFAAHQPEKRHRLPLAVMKGES